MILKVLIYSLVVNIINTIEFNLEITILIVEEKIKFSYLKLIIFLLK